MHLCIFGDETWCHFQRHDEIMIKSELKEEIIIDFSLLKLYKYKYILSIRKLMYFLSILSLDNLMKSIINITKSY